MIKELVKNISIGSKVYLAGLLLPLLTALSIGFFVYQRTATIGTEVARSQKITYPMANLAQQMKFHVAQVQQWLTDVSATGDPAGYKDAEDHAQKFQEAMARFEVLSAEDGQTQYKEELSDIKEKFTSYYKKGQQMATAYVEQGKEQGNALMEEFDTESENLSTALGHFVTEQEDQFNQSITEIRDDINALRLYAVLVSVFVLILCFFACEIIRRAITTPIVQLNSALGDVEHGDLTTRTTYQSKDEVGEISEKLNNTVKAMQSAINTIAASTQNLALSSSKMKESVIEISSSVTETSAQTESVSSSAEEINKSIEAIATASEEMAASTADSASHTQRAAAVAREAVTYVNETNVTITRLGQSSMEIDKVVALITSIAEQTNLLALNATIEAARAGEAGKGFAVVANEVKELAKQTAHATEEIGKRITGIRADTTSAVHAVENFNTIVGNISESLTTIASAVEEQSVTTNEISRNMAEATSGSKEIAHNISGIADVTIQVSARTNQILEMANQLTAMSRELSELVGKFRV